MAGEPLAERAGVGGVVAGDEFCGGGNYDEFNSAEELDEFVCRVGEAWECVVVLVNCFCIHDCWFLFGEITLFFCKPEDFPDMVYEITMHFYDFLNTERCHRKQQQYHNRTWVEI